MMCQLATLAGQLALLGRRANSFAAEQWLRADGDGRPVRLAMDPPGRCDPLGCVATLGNGDALSLVTDRAAFAEDCARAAIVVTALDPPASCKPRVLIGYAELAAGGAHAVRLNEDGSVTIARARAPLEDRPWSPAPPARRDPSPAPSAPAPLAPGAPILDDEIL